MTSLIVDASVAVKWFAAEPLSDEARELGKGRYGLIAPELVIAEVGNALWKKNRRGFVDDDEAIAAMERLPLLFVQLYGTESLACRAMSIAQMLRHPIYDCFYLALAEGQRVPLVTADSRLLSAATRLGTMEARGLIAMS